MSGLPHPIGGDGLAMSGGAGRRVGRQASAPLLVLAAAIAAFLALAAGLAYRQIATYEESVGRATQLYAVDVGSHTVSPVLSDESHWYWGPAWSPDGKHLVYSLALPDAKSTELTIASADGSNPRPLTHNGRSNYLPSWSPDSTRIAYISQNGDDVSSADLYVIGADGTGETRLTSNDAQEYGATWSPDGKRIVFGSDRDGAWKLYIMDADGGNPMQLLAAGDGNAPAWSPDGKVIAFKSGRSGHDAIYLFDVDARRLRQLTPDDGHDANNPVWSPDGTRIAFSWDRDGKGDVFVMNADGSDQANLTASADVAAAVPGWSADGKRIVFHASNPLPGQVWTIEAARLATVVLHAALFTALALFLLRRRSLPLGVLTALAALGGLVLGLVVEEPMLIVVVAASGLVGDLLLWRLRPLDGHAWRTAAAGLLIPLVVFGPALVAQAIRQGDDYPPVLVAAMVIAASIAGLAAAVPFRRSPSAEPA